MANPSEELKKIQEELNRLKSALNNQRSAFKPPSSRTDDKNLPQSSKELKNQIQKNSPQVLKDGAAGKELVEPLPNFIKADNETVIQGKNNTYIVLGRDRPSDRFSGHSATGEFGCGTIDLVAGRGGPNPSPLDENGEPQWLDNNFSYDASRIYISQRTDVDDNFSLRGPNFKDTAAIALKSDNIRIMARNDIKLVTSIAAKSSLAQPINNVGSIYLMPGNDEENLQRMVKGDNLVACLNEIITDVQKLNSVVAALISIQSDYNKAVAQHTHISPFFGQTVPPSPNIVTKIIKVELDYLSVLKTSLMGNAANLETSKQTFLNLHLPNNIGILSNNCYLT